MIKTVKIKRMAKEARTVPVICSWCKKLIRLVVWDVDEGRNVKSHGMCEKCHRKEIERIAD